MMTGHTPGPWDTEAVVSDDERDIILGYEVKGQGCPILIATTFGGEDEDRLIDAKQARANARVMAASPELFDVACLAREAFAVVMKEYGGVLHASTAEVMISKLDAAIAKATRAEPKEIA